MTTAGPRVLLTGASGLVGRAVRRTLDAAGWTVIECGRSVEAGGLRADLAAPQADLLRLCPVRPALVVHLAAMVPGPSAPDTKEAADLTSAMDRAVSRACAGWRCPSIYTSTCNLYDPGQEEFQRESDPVSTRTPYLAAKRAGEEQFLDIGNATVLRIPSPLAPGMPPHLVAPRMLAIALKGGTIEVWGSGSREQDFLWAGDFGRAVLAGARNPVGGIYNIATARPTTMQVLAETVVSVVGRGEVVVGRRADPREAETARYDTTAALDVFGWRAGTQLDTMIESLAGVAGTENGVSDCS